jgi:hypothetical protein
MNIINKAKINTKQNLNSFKKMAGFLPTVTANEIQKFLKNY